MERPRSGEGPRYRTSSSGSSYGSFVLPPLPPSSPSRSSLSSCARHRPASPPKALVTVGGQTLIAPNSTLARAIVMGNQMLSGAEHPEANAREESHAQASESRGSSHPRLSSPSKDYQRPRPVSNLTVLLNQHNLGVGEERSSPVRGSRPKQHHHRVLSSSSSAILPQGDEADSASGPAPQLGRSAPTFVDLPLLPPSQFARQHSAATHLSSGDVRR